MSFVVPLAQLGAVHAGAEALDEGLPAFTGAAAGDGIRVSFVSPGAPVTSNLVDSGGPSSRAFLSTGRGTRSLASLPYPGELFLTGPGLAAGFLGAAGFPLPAEAPPYPLLAAAEQPTTPESKVEAGPYQLKATTSDDSAEALAGLGVAAGEAAAGGLRLSSSASVRRSADGVLSSARSVFQAIKVGPLSLGEVSSAAEAKLGPAGEVTKASSLTVTGATVAGTPVAVESDGSPPPLAETLEALNALLAPSGISVELSPSSDTNAGIVSPVLVIRSQTPAGPGVNQGLFTIELGRVSASIETEATPVVEPAPAGPAGDDAEIVPGSDRSAPSSPPGMSAGGTVGATGPPLSAFSSTVTAPPRVASSGASAATHVPLAPGLGADAPPDRLTDGDVELAAPAAPAMLPSARLVSADTFDLDAVYASVAGLAVATAAFMFFRARGVRAPWHS